LTSDQHTDHIAIGQQVSRHSLPTLLFFIFFAYPHFFKTTLANRTLAHLVLPQHTKPTLRKTKRANFPTLNFVTLAILNFNYGRI